MAHMWKSLSYTHVSVYTHKHIFRGSRGEKKNPNKPKAKIESYLDVSMHLRLVWLFWAGGEKNRTILRMSGTKKSFVF